MSVDSVVFAALVGFLFLAIWPLTRLTLLRLDGYRVLFASAITGTGILIVAHSILRYGERFAAWELDMARFIPFENPGLIGLSIVLAVLSGVILDVFGRLWTKIFDVDLAWKLAVRRGHQILELLCDRMGTDRVVAVTLRSRKCYVGFPTNIHLPFFRSDPDVTLIPQASGYRSQETGILILTTSYQPPGEGVSWRDTDLRVTFPFSEIVSAASFDPELYKSFQTPPAEQSSDGSGAMDSN